MSEVPAKPGLIARAQRFITSALGRAFAGSFAVAILARLAQLIMAVLLARQLGPAGYGTFTFALGAAILGGQFASLGWPTLMARFIPQYTVDADLPLLRGLVRAGDAVVFGATAGLAAIIYFLSLSPVLPHDLGAGLALAALLIVPMGFRLLRRHQLAAVQKAPLGLTFDELPAPLAVVLVSLLVGAGNVEQAFFVYVGASLLGAVLATAALWRYLPEGWRQAAATYKTAMWMGVALPMMVGLSAKALMNRTDVIMLAPLSSFEEVGYYGAAFRVTYLLTFPQVILMTMVTPMIGEAIAQRDQARLRRLFTSALAFAFFTAVPVALIVWPLRHSIASTVFGAEFIHAADPLGILTVSQSLAAFSMPLSALLMMASRQKFFGVLTVSALFLNITLNFWLIPPLGAVGASWATMVSTLFLFLFQCVACSGSFTSSKRAGPLW